MPRGPDGVTVPETVEGRAGLGPWALEWITPFLEFIGSV